MPGDIPTHGGTGCGLPAGGSSLRAITPPGVRCVAVFDPGTLTAPVRYAVRIGYYR